MNRLFAISVIFLFSILILNAIFIVKKDIKENERKELNQKIDNSIIQPLHKYKIETLKTKREKEIDHKLIERKVVFA